jgi:hypothetical protein
LANSGNAISDIINDALKAVLKWTPDFC